MPNAAQRLGGHCPSGPCSRPALPDTARRRGPQTLALALLLLTSLSALPGTFGQRPGARVDQIAVNFEGEEYILTPLKLAQIRGIFGVEGGYVRLPDGSTVTSGDALVDDPLVEFILPGPARPRPALDPVRSSFFDRVRFREKTGELRYARTLRQYWEVRRSLMAEHFGRYVYFCGGAVQGTSGSADAFLHPPAQAIQACGGEAAFIARVGSEIETSYTYQNGRIDKYETMEGPVVAGSFASVDLQAGARTMDRRQQDIKRFIRLESVLLDTGAEEVNLLPGDIPSEHITAFREVENHGLHGSGYARFVPVSLKFSNHTGGDYKRMFVLLNDDPLAYRLLGMRFLQNFYTMIAGPDATWASEPNALGLCARYLTYSETKALKSWHLEVESQKEAAASAA